MKSVTELLTGVIAEFGQLIKDISIVEINETENSYYVKAIFVFIDDSTLRVAESVKMDRNFSRYSYYWLTSDGNLIIGWDNAPHHKKVNTYPDHKHIGTRKKVEPSIERDLRSVMKYISVSLAVKDEQ